MVKSFFSVKEDWGANIKLVEEKKRFSKWQRNHLKVKWVL